MLVDRIELVASTDDADACVRHVLLKHWPASSRYTVAYPHRLELVRRWRGRSLSPARPPAAAGATLLPDRQHVARRSASRASPPIDGSSLTRKACVDRGRRRVASTEEEIYAALGLPFIPPELRERRRGVDRGAHGTASALVSRDDIRGDLHMHTHLERRPRLDRSDGRGRRARSATNTSRSPITRTHSAASRNLSTRRRRAAGRRNRRAARALSARSRSCTAAKSTSCPTAASTSPTRCSSASTSSWRRCTTARASRRTNCCERYLRRHAASARLDHHAPDQPRRSRRVRATTSTSTPLRARGRDRHGARNRRRAVAPRPRRRRCARRAVAGRRDAGHRQRLPPRGVLGRQMQLGCRTARRGWVEPRHVLNTSRWPRSARSSTRNVLAAYQRRMPALLVLAVSAATLHRSPQRCTWHSHAPDLRTVAAPTARATVGSALPRWRRPDAACAERRSPRPLSDG